MKKSGSRVPRIELEDMGPSVDFIMRRTKLASEDLYKRSLKVPKTATVSKLKVKNVYRHLEIIFDIFFFYQCASFWYIFHFFSIIILVQAFMEIHKLT